MIEPGRARLGVSAHVVSAHVKSSSCLSIRAKSNGARTLSRRPTEVPWAPATVWT